MKRKPVRLPVEARGSRHATMAELARLTHIPASRRSDFAKSDGATNARFVTREELAVNSQSQHRTGKTHCELGSGLSCVGGREEGERREREKEREEGKERKEKRKALSQVTLRKATEERCSGGSFCFTTPVAQRHPPRAARSLPAGWPCPRGEQTVGGKKAPLAT